jgi:diamine N-acetyltransferase
MAFYDDEQSYWLWKLMIDGRYQHLGYGRRSVEFAIAYIRQQYPDATQFKVYSTPPEGKTSEDPGKVVKPEDSPYRFYLRLGFREVAPPDKDGETLMVFDL